MTTVDATLVAIARALTEKRGPDAEPVEATEAAILDAIEHLVPPRGTSEPHPSEPEWFLESIVENIPDMIFVKDAENLSFVRVNSALEEIVGRSREELIGGRDEDFFTPDEVEFFAQKDREVLRRGRLVDIPEEPLHVDSGVRWLHTKKIPLLDVEGRPRYLLGISRDITDRKRTEATLRVLVENIPGAVWFADERLVVRSTAGLHRPVLGLKDAVGRPLHELLVSLGIDSPGIATILAGQSYDGDVAVGERHYAVRMEPLDASHGTGMVGIAIDVTDCKRVEAQRLEAQLLRTQKMESLGLLAGGIAHDFNNLLVGVVGNASLALEALEPTSSTYASVQRVLVSAERASDLTRQLLAYSGKGRFVVERMDFSDLAREMTQLLQVGVDKNARLVMELDDDLPPVHVDVSQVRQLVLNLITNASDALTHRSGTIRVQTSRVELTGREDDPFVLSPALHVGPYVRLVVSDTGCGMAPETIGRMFEPFFTTKPDGHGLGLAAALGIVRGHGGGIRVESSPGRGTRVEVLFPAGSPATVERPVASPPATSASRGTILVVDDEPDIRTFVAEVLDHRGFDVLLAANGRQAIERYAAEGEQIAAVLLDMTMPYLDGMETLAALRAMDPTIRVLLSSGYSNRHALEGLDEGPEPAFLQKPYRATELVRAILQVLNGNGA